MSQTDLIRVEPLTDSDCHGVPEGLRDGTHEISAYRQTCLDKLNLTVDTMNDAGNKEAKDQLMKCYGLANVCRASRCCEMANAVLVGFEKSDPLNSTSFYKVVPLCRF